MRYLGGKSRLAKKFAPILKEALEKREGRLYEPFVGGFNVVPALGESVKDAHCSDIHKNLIVMYQALQVGWEPPENLSKEEYDQLRKIEGYSPLKAFAAFGCSFGGKEWGGYARDKGRNYTQESKNLLLKKKEFMGPVTFSCHDYRDFIPKNSVIYCDPPYHGESKTHYPKAYKSYFNYKDFCEWCQRAANTNDVFVSEFSAPLGWEIVWELERKVTMRRDSRYASKVDRLYKVTTKDLV